MNIQLQIVTSDIKGKKWVLTENNGNGSEGEDLIKSNLDEGVDVREAIS